MNTQRNTFFSHPSKPSGVFIGNFWKSEVAGVERAWKTVEWYGAYTDEGVPVPECKAAVVEATEFFKKTGLNRRIITCGFRGTVRIVTYMMTYTDPPEASGGVSSFIRHIEDQDLLARAGMLDTMVPGSFKPGVARLEVIPQDKETPSRTVVSSQDYQWLAYE